MYRLDILGFTCSNYHDGIGGPSWAWTAHLPLVPQHYVFVRVVLNGHLARVQTVRYGLSPLCHRDVDGTERKGHPVKVISSRNVRPSETPRCRYQCVLSTAAYTL
jgi:hypothetical protein